MDTKELTKMKRRVRTLQNQLGKLGPVMRGSVVIIGTRNKQPYFSLNKNKKTRLIYLGKKREDKAREYGSSGQCVGGWRLRKILRGPRWLISPLASQIRPSAQMIFLYNASKNKDERLYLLINRMPQNYFIIIRVMKTDENKTYEYAFLLLPLLRPKCVPFISPPSAT